MEEIELRANGLRFGALTVGDGARRALLLHGFPDSPHSMLPVGERLADAGFRVVAPWMRGYGPTELPPDGNYQIASLACDVVGLLDALNWERSLVVGHDWGAVASYAACNLAPHRFTALVGLAVPPLRLFVRNGLRSIRQWLRSWYILAAQVPVVPEWWLSHDDFEGLELIWREALRLESRAEVDARIEEAKRTFRRPGTLHAALGYYRALVPGRSGSVREFRDTWGLAGGRLQRPTLMVAGTRDVAVGAETFDSPGRAFESDWELEFLRDAGHFVQLESPDVVGDHILSFVE